MAADSKSLVEKVLGDPSLYPGAFTSFLARYLSGNALVTFTQQQLPSIEPRRMVGDIANGEPPFLGAVGNFGGSLESVGFYKTPEGIVHLFGVAVWDAVGNTGFALPSGYRPRAKEQFAVYTNTGAGRIDIDQNGNVALGAGGTASVTLSGISFRAA